MKSIFIFLLPVLSICPWAHARNATKGLSEEALSKILNRGSGAHERQQVGIRPQPVAAQAQAQPVAQELTRAAAKARAEKGAREQALLPIVATDEDVNKQVDLMVSEVKRDYICDMLGSFPEQKSLSLEPGSPLLALWKAEQAPTPGTLCQALRKVDVRTLPAKSWETAASKMEEMVIKDPKTIPSATEWKDAQNRFKNSSAILELLGELLQKRLAPAEAANHQSGLKSLLSDLSGKWDFTKIEAPSRIQILDLINDARSLENSYALDKLRFQLADADIARFLEQNKDRLPAGAIKSPKN